MYDYPFHMLFLMYSFLMTSYRSYFTGYAYATGEKVSQLEEGLTLRVIRYGLGGPFLFGCLLYLINPRWMMWSYMDCITPGWRWLGMFLLLGSLLLYRWTHEYLDKNFTDTVYVRDQAFLVTAGPYKWVRHPMYVAGLLIGVGTGLGLANWFLGITGAVVILVIMIWRTPIEERKLAEKHGEAWRRYKERTWKYFPKFF